MSWSETSLLFALTQVQYQLELVERLPQAKSNLSFHCTQGQGMGSFSFLICCYDAMFLVHLVFDTY